MKTMTRVRGPHAAWIVLLVVLATAALLAAAAHAALSQMPAAPVQVIVDGTEVLTELDYHALSAGQRIALVAGIAALAMVALILVPVALVIAMLAGIVATVVGIGVPTLLVLLLAALVLSPLIAIVALLVWALRRPARALPPATMPVR